MATGRDVVYGALSYNLNRQAEAAIEDDELEDGIRVLNQWLSSLEENDVSLGFTWLSDADDLVTVPTGALLGIEQNLALQLVPMFGGKINPVLPGIARQSMQSLLSLGIEPPKLSYPSTMPRGSGRPWYRSNYEVFFLGDDRPEATMSFKNNTTNTTISTVSTPVIIAGTWTDVLSKHFDFTSAGLLTYTGENPVQFDITGRFTVTVAAKHVNIYAYVNDIQITPSKTGGYVETSSIIPFFSSVLLEKNDTLQFYIENIDDATDILVPTTFVSVV